MKKLLGVFVLFLLFPAFLRAQGTYTAATCNQSDVNAVINGPKHTAVNGDTINIPAGTCTWTTGIVVPSGIGISIIGSGAPNSSPTTYGAASSCTATSITDNVSGNPLLYFQPTATSSLSRVSCMKLTSTLGANTTVSPIQLAGTCNSSTCPNVRVDNLTFDGSLQGTIKNSDTVMVTDNVFGVLDHNSMSGTGVGSYFEFVNYNNSAWNGVGAYGDNSWTSADTFGTSKALYLENNTFGTAVVMAEGESDITSKGQTAQGGGRVVGRFNNCNGCTSGVSNHGTDTNGRPRGGRQIEFYGNTYQCTNTSGGCQGGVPIRSGVNIMFGNSLTAISGSWFNQYMALAALRVPANGGLTSSSWGLCDGTGPYDNNGASPPVCIDQPSRSGGTLLSGNPGSPTGWVNEAIDPSYEWDDSGYNPVFGNVTSDYSGMVANRDWYTDNSSGTPHVQTSQTSPFNGTSGMGFGTLANRPTSCTTGVGYWVTNLGSWNQSSNTYTGGYSQGELFVCTATNTWTLYYTPYIYPHPLTTGTAGDPPPNPPTGLAATVQ
jgi:hypothetical protein